MVHGCWREAKHARPGSEKIETQRTPNRSYLDERSSSRMQPLLAGTWISFLVNVLSNRDVDVQHTLRQHIKSQLLWGWRQRDLEQSSPAGTAKRHLPRFFATQRPTYARGCRFCNTLTTPESGQIHEKEREKMRRSSSNQRLLGFLLRVKNLPNRCCEGGSTMERKTFGGHRKTGKFRSDPLM